MLHFRLKFGAIMDRGVKSAKGFQIVNEISGPNE